MGPYGAVHRAVWALRMRKAICHTAAFFKAIRVVGTHWFGRPLARWGAAGLFFCYSRLKAEFWQGLVHKRRMETHLDSQTKLLPKETAHEISIDQDIFLIDSEDSTCAIHTLNSGAAIIWLLCDRTRDVESIAREIAATYSLAEEEVLAQVQETVEQLQSLGLTEP